MTTPIEPVVSPRERIIDKTQRVVRAYAAGKDDWNAASSLTKLLQQMRQEYEGRFLYELIQNAYDAHPVDAEGHIAVLLDLDEGTHGVLYVANTGRAFSDRNFEAICELAQSDKAPGESIGNKGVGFKSVLQVCDWPEIYSASEIRAERFGGYCFTFARPEEYDELAGGNVSLADEMRRDLTPYFLPVPLDDQSDRVREFARKGMATVIRLPIKSDAARAVAIERVDRLRDEEVPVQLFLERLRTLEIVSLAGGEGAAAITLTRDSLPIDDPGADPEQRYEYVNLASQGTWFISSRRMPAEQMRAAIAESVEAGQLDESWSGWSSDAWVSVAVRLDGSEVQPRLYTYLPMEREAKAPLHGHLHAPFSTMLARTAISENVALNAKLLDLAARAGAAAVLTFSDNDGVLPDVALVDLLAWDAHHFDRVTVSFEAALDGEDPSEVEVVPIEPLPDGRRRGALKNTYRWDDEDLSLLDRRRLARDAGAEVISDAIEGARLVRLDVYRRSFFHDSGFDPSSELRAEWIESIARELHAHAARPRTWDRFYSEVALVLKDDPDALRGRNVLLGADGRLHAPPPDDDDKEAVEHPFVFFPPARERTDEDDEVEGDVDLKPPATLQRALVLMSEDLTWTRQEGRIRRTTPARKFLEQNKLVRRFKTVDLLEHVGRALQRDHGATLAADALRFAYRLYTGTRRPSELKGISLRVPTRGGWRPAHEAAFSPHWKTPFANQLAELVDRSPGLSRSLAELGNSLLKDPGEVPGIGGDLEGWRAFLSEIGVRDGLWPQTAPHGGDPRNGSALKPRTLARRFRLSEGDTERWVAAVETTPGWTPNHPFTPYRPRTDVALIPGQTDYDAFDHRARVLFAELVAAGLVVWPDGALEIEWHRFKHPRQQDQRRWPSPITSFLRDVPWVPVSHPGQRREETFATPGEAWFFAEARGEEPPYFSPLVAGKVLRLLGASRRASERARCVGMGDWDEPRDAPRLLRHLAALVGGGALPETGVLAFRRAYVDAWARAASLSVDDAKVGLECLPVVVARSGDLQVVRADDGDEETVYLLSDERSLAGRILAASDLPVLAVDADVEEHVRTLLNIALPGRVQPAQALDIDVVMDHGSFVPDGTGVQLLKGRLAWLETLIALILEMKRGPSSLGPRRRREVIDRLLRVRVVRSQLLELHVGGSVVKPPERHRHVVALDNDLHPTLILRSKVTDAELALEDALVLARPLCELLAIAAYEDSLVLSLERLQRQGCDAPSDADFARILDVTKDWITEARAHIGSSAERLVRVLAPVVGCRAGVHAALNLLDARDSVHTVEDVRQLLLEIVPGLDDVDRMLAAGLAATFSAELRESLGIDYGHFNAVLSELPGYQPVHNVEGHQTAMAHFVQTHRATFMDDLRSRYVTAFRDSAPLDAYVEARSLDLSPDPAWLDVYDLPPEDALGARVAEWMTGHGAPSATHNIPTVEAAREQNSTLIADVSGVALTLVPAWARKNSAPLHEIWTRDGAVAAIGVLAASLGILDFVVFEKQQVLAWFRTVGLWPAAMPLSLSPADVGLSEADMVSQENVAQKEKLERRRRQRIVVLDNTEMSADRDNYAAIVKHVNDTLRDETLSPHRATQLAEVPDRGTRSGTDTSRGGGSRHSLDQLSQAQKSVVGLVGEVVAYAWLCKRYPEICKASSWVSTYREIFGEPPGDDSLGYDFVIPLRRKRIYFEVKATTGADTRFELGKSEVRKASECTRRSGDDYYIIFITRALSADARWLHLLHNPMDPANARYYSFPGSGLICTFQLA